MEQSFRLRLLMLTAILSMTLIGSQGLCDPPQNEEEKQSRDNLTWLMSINGETWQVNQTGKRGISRVRLSKATPAHLRELVDVFPGLEMVYLNPVEHFSEADLQVLQKLPNLKIFWFVHNVNNEHLRAISQLSQLEELNFIVRSDAESPASGELRDFSVLQKLHNLRTLSLGVGFNGYSPEEDQLGADVLNQLPQLTELRLYNGSVSSQTLQSIGTLSHLQRLTVPRIRNLNSGDLRALSNLRELESMSFSVYGSDEAMLHLASLKKLTTLSGFSDMTDEGMRHLASMKNLEQLSLSSPKITDASIHYLSGLRKLKSVILSSPQIQGSGFESLEDVPQLEFLKLRQTGFEEKNVHALTQIASLQRVDLSWTPFNASGQWRALAILKDMKNLKEVEIELSESDRQQLMKMLPGVFVTYLD